MKNTIREHVDGDTGNWDLIPPAAIAALRPAQTATSHRLVVYFGDKTYEWMPYDSLLDYSEYVDEMAKQPVVKARARYRRALEEACEWWRRQAAAVLTPAARAAAVARAKEEEELRRAVGATSSDAPAVVCGRCRVCQSRARQSSEIPFSLRHRARSCAKPSTLAPLRGVKDVDVCPQLEVITAARKGHVGASLALLRDRAVGRRINVHWANERKPFAGTVVGFDEEKYLHSIEYDDGDIEPAVRLWRETVHLRVAEDNADIVDAEAVLDDRQLINPGTTPQITPETEDARAITDATVKGNEICTPEKTSEGGIKNRGGRSATGKQGTKRKECALPSADTRTTRRASAVTARGGDHSSGGNELAHAARIVDMKDGRGTSGSGRSRR